RCALECISVTVRHAPRTTVSSIRWREPLWLCGARLLEGPEEFGQQERLEAVPADGDDLLLLRVERDARGAGQADAGPLDDRARRNVAVVVGRVDGDEAHLIETSLVAVVIVVARLRRARPRPPLVFLPRLVEHVGFHLLHARVLLREEDVAGRRIDRDLAEVR